MKKMTNEERQELVSRISDGYKDFYNHRPKLSWTDLSDEELLQWDCRIEEWYEIRENQVRELKAARNNPKAFILLTDEGEWRKEHNIPFDDNDPDCWSFYIPEEAPPITFRNLF